MPAKSATKVREQAESPSRESWLRKHADYQRVYREGKRQSLPLMTYFFAPRTHADSAMQPNDVNPMREPNCVGSRIGLTAGKVLGNAVQRNRIKRRMREAVRQHRRELTASVDVILHPRRTVLEAEFSQIEREVLRALRAVQAAVPTMQPAYRVTQRSAGRSRPRAASGNSTSAKSSATTSDTDSFHVH